MTTVREAPTRAALQRVGGLARTSVFQLALSAAAVQLLNVASGPLLARMLGPAGRGDVVIVSMASLLCARLSAGGTAVAFARTVAASSARPARDVLRGTLSTRVLRLVPWCVPAPIVAWVLLRDRPESVLLAVGALLAALLTGCQFLLMGMLQGEGRTARVAVVPVIATAVYVVPIVVVFVVAPIHHAVEAVVMAVVAQAASSLLTLFMMRRSTGHPPPEDVGREVAVFARKAWSSGIQVSTLGFDYLAVVVIGGATQLGLYSVAASMTNLPMVTMNSVAGMMLARIVAATPETRPAVTRQWILRSLALLTAMTLAMEVVLGVAIRVLFGPAFIPTIGTARMLTLAWALLGFRLALTSILQARGAVGVASRIETAAGGAMIAAAALGMWLDGIFGAATAVAAVALASVLALARLIQTVPDTGDVPEVERVNDTGTARGPSVPGRHRPRPTPAVGAATIAMRDQDPAQGLVATQRPVSMLRLLSVYRSRRTPAVEPVDEPTDSAT